MLILLPKSPEIQKKRGNICRYFPDDMPCTECLLVLVNNDQLFTPLQTQFKYNFFF